MKKIFVFIILVSSSLSLVAQINTDKVLMIGRNSLYYEDYVLAIQYFNQVIQAKPYLAEPYYYRAVAKFLLDDNKGAEEDCSLCLAQNPFMSNAYNLRADARLNENDFTGAIEDYKKSQETTPDGKSLLINLGIAYIQNKNYPEAEETLNKLIKLYPTYTQGILTRGQMYLEKGDTIQGLTDLDKAISIDKYFPQSYAMRGLVYYKQKKYDDALSDYNEAVKLAPETIGNYINRGLVKYYKSDLRGSMADYDHVIEMDPNNTMVRFNRGLLKAQVGDDNNAIKDFDVVLLNESDNYIAYLNRSILYAKIAKYTAALADLNKVMDKYPEFYQGYYNRSEIKKKLGDLRGAERDLALARKEEQQIRNNPSQANKEDDGKTREKSDNTINKFNLLVVADKTEDEKNKYSDNARGRVQDRQTKIELESPFFLTYYKNENNLGHINYSELLEAINKDHFLKQTLYLSSKDSPLTEDQIKLRFASIDQFSKLIVQNQNNFKNYFARGMDYFQVQNFAAAIADFQKVISLEPTQVLAYFNLGVLYSKLQEINDNAPESEKKTYTTNSTKNTASPIFSALPKNEGLAVQQALDYYTKVIKLNPKFSYAYYNRAGLKSYKKNYRDAILDYDEAIKLNAQLGEAYFNRGLNYLSIGNKTQGLDDLRKAGEMGIANAYSVIKRMTD